eukprot:c28386_g2_i1 orf=1122-2972(+)
MTMTASADKSSVPKRTSNSVLTAKRTGEGMYSDVQNDVIIQVDGVAFALHKFPLVSRSRRIRTLLAEKRDLDPSQIELPSLPGGAEAFELAAKFCYGIKFEITTSNVACLRCAADYLEMAEDYKEGNLIALTEAYLNEVVLQSLERSVEVLHSCETILQISEEMKIVSRCIDAIASKACNKQMGSSLSPLGYKSSHFNTHSQKTTAEWWVEDLSILRIDLFQRVLAAMRSRGLQNESIGGALLYYAQRSLKSLNKKQGHLESSLHSKSNASLEHEQRILVETIVSLLPIEKANVPVSFLFGLLRTAIILDTTVACRLDLERRIGLQLEQATLDDLLIPSFSNAGDTLFDVDIVHRVLVNFLQQEENQEFLSSYPVYESDDLASPGSKRSITRIAKLTDMYLAEIAADVNLKVSKFITLAELFPDYARAVDDGLYRAVDIYLKAHPTLSELERKKICKLMDCQKLSQEACTHAAQNERLPVQFVVQVLYFEQLRLRNAMAGSYAEEHSTQCYTAQRINTGALSDLTSPKDNYASLRHENQELKLEVTRMRMRMNDLESKHANMKQDMEKTSTTNKFLNSVSKKLGKINPFSRVGSKDGNSKLRSDVKFPKRRRHSIS